MLVGCTVAAGTENSDSTTSGVDAKTCEILGYSTDGKERLFVFDAPDAPNPDPAHCKATGQVSWAFTCEMSVCLKTSLPGSCPICK